MLTAPSLYTIEYICLNMRQSDREEIFGLRPYDDPLRFAWDSWQAVANLGRGRVAWANGKPAAIFAFTNPWPTNWEVWMFGTDDFRSAAIPLLRWARTEAKDILSSVDGRRLQCDVRMGHPDAHKLVKALGALAEGPPMKAYGKDGSAYQRYVWFNGENDAVLKPHFTRVA